jgi:hypothetical protein
MGLVGLILRRRSTGRTYVRAIIRNVGERAVPDV